MRSEPAGGSAFSRRDAPFLLGIEANWEDPADGRRQHRAGRARSFAEAERSSRRGGTYLNFAGFAEEGEALLRAVVRRELRAAAGGEGEVRPGERLPGQP